MRWLVPVFVCLICCEARYIPQDGIYSVPDKMPVYAEGMPVFEQLLLTGIADIEQFPEGKLYLSFIVNTTGEMDSVKITKGLTNEIDSQVLVNSKNPEIRWKSGESNGEKVMVRMVYVINIGKANQ